MDLVAGSYTVTRELPFPVEKVFKAWTDPDQIAAWYGPVGMSSPRESVSSDLKVGGKWSATVIDPQGGQHIFVGEYLEIKENEYIKYTLDYSNPAMPNMPKYPDGIHEVVTLTFKPTEAGSILTFTQDGYLPAAQIPYAQAGMESYFDSLTEYLKTH